MLLRCRPLRRTLGNGRGPSALTRPGCPNPPHTHTPHPAPLPARAAAYLQTMYMVTSGTHYNNRCCFDYGNAETNNLDDGAGTMEAVYFGNAKGGLNHGGAGTGPWIMADMENALWGADVVVSNEPEINHKFVTAMVKGDVSTPSGVMVPRGSVPGHWAIKGGDAQQGGLKVYWDGKRAPGYAPMKKQGAIILGIGGDNSDGAVGTFCEELPMCPHLPPLTTPPRRNKKSLLLPYCDREVPRLPGCRATWGSGQTDVFPLCTPLICTHPPCGFPICYLRNRRGRDDGWVRVRRHRRQDPSQHRGGRLWQVKAPAVEFTLPMGGRQPGFPLLSVGGGESTGDALCGLRLLSVHYPTAETK